MKKGISILLSLILLLGHVSLTRGTHYCGGEAVETKILFDDTRLGCDMMDMQSTCNLPVKSAQPEEQFEKVPCCDNDYQTIRLSNEYVKDVVQFTINIEFAATFVYSSLFLDAYPMLTHPVDTGNSSLPPGKDVQVHFQVFLV